VTIPARPAVPARTDRRPAYRPARHRLLLEQPHDECDGWAITTSPDGLAAYHPLPPEVRILAWVRPNAQPSGNRIRQLREAVILRPPPGEHAVRASVPDVLIEPAPRRKFVGQKPDAWTWWVLYCFGCIPDIDTVADLFPRSGAITYANQPGE